jgi:hypothetical protein
VLSRCVLKRRRISAPGREMWERTFGTHQMPLKSFWKLIGFEPAAFMTVGIDLLDRSYYYCVAWSRNAPHNMGCMRIRASSVINQYMES